ncbi:hypothetical protein N7481_006079 [Penicillium waksmanii]|uniref:uncharacterized protein n=1 Tax=Penicillium waksmanii TaxID=69791 RepID=UPI002547F82D|nr:uncharacterized protein N7481_006079 [Penicillium waksmanii]KAJ5983980.1 hypothetical protein N7481_006079 [Penicillium waksmanii]
MRYTYLFSAFAEVATETATPTSSSLSAQTSAVEIPAAWNNVDLDKWIRMIVNETVIEPITNVTEKAEKESHIDTALGIMECYFDISSAASCEKNVLKPFAYYTRLGVYYSREWYKKIYNKYYVQVKQWKAKATSFVTDFTHHDLSCKKGCNYFALAKKALKSWKSVLSGSSSLLGGFDFSSAGLSFASGVVAATKSNVTEIFQKELSQPDNVKEALLNTAGLVKNASVAGFYASAINVAWALENVYVAKASDKINDQKPADMDLSILGDNARTCDDNETCYFFIVAQNISNISGNWTATKGLDKIQEYRITLLELAQSATWFQKTFGGYSAQPNATALLQSLQANDTKPNLSYFVNLPVIDFDNVKYASSDKSSAEKTFLGELNREISSIKSWPYAKSSKSAN